MNQPIKLVAKGVGKKKSLRETNTTIASLTTTVPPVKTWGILQFTGIQQAFLVDNAQNRYGTVKRGVRQIHAGFGKPARPCLSWVRPKGKRTRRITFYRSVLAT